MKSIFLVIFLLMLSSCSFTPLLEKDDSQSTQSGAKLVVGSKSKNGTSYLVHQLRQRLKRSLTGLNLDNSYKIFVRLNEESGSVAYAADATASRSMDRLSVQLIINKDSQAVFETTLNAVTSYSQNVNDEFVNQSAQLGAKERLIETLSTDIARELHRFAKTVMNDSSSKN
jgi:hypothetical protein